MWKINWKTIYQIQQKRENLPKELKSKNNINQLLTTLGKIICSEIELKDSITQRSIDQINIAEKEKWKHLRMKIASKWYGTHRNKERWCKEHGKYQSNNRWCRKTFSSNRSNDRKKKQSCYCGSDKVKRKE